MLSTSHGSQEKVTLGFLVAVEIQKGSVHPDTIRDVMKDRIEAWDGKADVEYLGEIDCYEEEK